MSDHHGPRAVMNAVERLAGGSASECAHVRQDLTIAESQLRDYRARLGKPFLHAAYLTALTAACDQLKSALAGACAESGNDRPLSVFELAEQIKTLRAAQTVEAAPTRIGKRRGSAEEPVTTRIRQRMEATLATAPTSEPSAE